MYSFESVPLNLSNVFQAVHSALLPQREVLNQADSERGKHGDEMLSLFAVLAAPDEQPLPQTALTVVMDRAAERAAGIRDNQSALFYSQGLACFADSVRNLDLTAGDLALYLRSTLMGAPKPPDTVGQVSQGQLLKALIKGLSAWDAQQSSPETKPPALSMGYLFDLGVDYLQALQHGATRLDAIVEAAVRHSPLRAPAYRAASGKLVLTSFLEALVHQSAQYQGPASG